MCSIVLHIGGIFMAIREIIYNVTPAGVTPAYHLWGGVQNEDNATNVVYVLDSTYLETLGALDNLRFRIDFNSASAGYEPSENLTLNNSRIERAIPQRMTQYGGQMECTLVISRIIPENLPEVSEVILQIPSIVFFTASGKQSARFDKNLSAYEEYVGRLITQAADEVSKAESASESARASAIIAGNQVTLAGEQVALAGEQVTLAKNEADRAENACVRAENAASNANTDANRAGIAAQSATTSAFDARGYKVEANESATKAKEAQQKAEEAYTKVTRENVLFSNALKGTSSGEAIGINDVSPIEHEISVKISGVDDLTSVKVLKYGGNLLNFPSTYSWKGLYAAHTNTNVKTVLKPNIRYALSYDEIEYSEQGDGLVFVVNGNAILAWTEAKKPNYFTLDKEVTDFYIYTNGWNYNASENTTATVTNLRIYTAENDYLEYEPYIEPTEYTPDADGVVSGVTSLYPSTTLMTDTDGAVIDAIYNKDINKAFEELKNAILATGGNV